MKKAAEKAKQALVIGGSFIGVELAVALRQIGLPVKLIMLEKYLWQALLPESIGNYLMDKLIAGGVEIYPEEKVVEFEGSNGWVKAVKTESGKIFEADLVGVGVGLTLNVELLNSTEVKIGGGIQVNEFLETNVEGIHAAGDVAEFDDLILGMKHVVGHIENAQLQGKTAGRNMAGAKVPYAEMTGYDSGIFDMPLIFVGALEFVKEHWIRGKGEEPSLGSFAIRDGRVVGVFLIKPKGKEMKVVRELIKIRDINMKGYEDELRNHATDLAALVKNLTRGS